MLNIVVNLTWTIYFLCHCFPRFLNFVPVVVLFEAEVIQTGISLNNFCQPHLEWNGCHFVSWNHVPNTHDFRCAIFYFYRIMLQLEIWNYINKEPNVRNPVREIDDLMKHSAVSRSLLFSCISVASNKVSSVSCFTKPVWETSFSCAHLTFVNTYL